MKNSYYRNKEQWEQARLISFLIAQTHSSKKLKVDDILKFSWEKEEKAEEEKITEADIEFLERQAEEYKRLLENG